MSKNGPIYISRKWLNWLYRDKPPKGFYGRGCQEKHLPAERTTVPNTVVAASPCLR